MVVLGMVGYRGRDRNWCGSGGWQGFWGDQESHSCWFLFFYFYINAAVDIDVVVVIATVDVVVLVVAVTVVVVAVIVIQLRVIYQVDVLTQ